MDAFPTLQTTRLVLRELTSRDAPTLFAIHGNAQAMRYFGTDPLKSLVEAQESIERFAMLRTAPNPGARWGLEDKATGQLLGTCGLFAWNRDWRKCGIAYDLEPLSQGKGFMREALCAIIAWGFAEMALNRIKAQIHPDNGPSLRLANRLGFHQEGLLREVAYWGGQFHDLAQFGLLRRQSHPQGCG